MAALREGAAYPLLLSTSAVAGVVLGALYMLWFAQRFLFGAAKAPHLPLADLNLREKAILASIVVAVFALGLFPDEPMRKTELAARQYQQLVSRRADRNSDGVAFASATAARLARSVAAASAATTCRKAHDELADDSSSQCFRSICCSPGSWC